MIRKASAADLEPIGRIYDAIHTQEEAGLAVIGWIRGVYPTDDTAREAIQAGEMFVMVEDGQVLAAAKINRTQDPAYAGAHWADDAPEDQVMVLHTLVVAPWAAGRGIGTSFVAFYEAYARENGCPYLRMDTNARNAAARALYKRLGYRESDIVPCVFNGIEGVQLVCLEKTL